MPDMLAFDPAVAGERAAVRLMLRSLVILAFAAAAIAAAGAQTADKEKHMIEGVRDARYCEIIPVVRRGIHLRATVYNTLGLNDCPPAIWDKITEAAMKKRFRAPRSLLNGPRHFLMDEIAAAGDTAAGQTVEAGGLSLTARATIELSLFGLRSKPYRERTIDRETRYVFKAGKPVFLLVRPDGTPLRHAVLCADDRQIAVLCRPAGTRRPAQAARRLALRDHDAGDRSHPRRAGPRDRHPGRS